MIDYIIYGEFDINEGNVIKLEYPQKTGINEMVLASYLIPEGTHNIMNDCFCFIINKKPNAEEIICQNLKQEIDKLSSPSSDVIYLDLTNNQSFHKNVSGKKFKIKEMYNYNSNSAQWESWKINNPSSGSDCNFTVEADSTNTIINKQNNNLTQSTEGNKKIFNINVYKNSENLFKIPLHNDIQFKLLGPCFASIYTLHSQAIGFEFEGEESLIQINKIFEEMEYTQTIVKKTPSTEKDKKLNGELFDCIDYSKSYNSEGEIYFLCVLETKLDKSTKRGAILKSLSIGTRKLINLMIFQPLGKKILEEIFKIHTFNIGIVEKMDLVKKLVELAYKGFNSSVKLDMVSPSIPTRVIHSYLNANTYFQPCFKKDDQIIDVDIGNVKVSTELQIADHPEKIFPGSLIELITTFKENAMVIYDAIISEKKILFIGDSNTSCGKLCSYIFSCLSLIINTCPGMIKRIHPYKNLYDLEFLKTPCPIFGVTNPIFKNKTDSWDIMCEIDSGKVNLSENMKKHQASINRETDQAFIKEIIYRVKSDPTFTEYEALRYFKMYTSHLMKITQENYFSDDLELTNEINKQYKRKVKLQITTMYKMFCVSDEINQICIVNNGRSYKQIQSHVDNLYYRKVIESGELISIYADIFNFIKTEEYDEQYANLLLAYLLNNTSDFQFFLNGLFSKYSEIVHYTKSILKEIEKYPNGKILLKKMNYLFIIRGNSLDLI
jgi:hypothetical protein